MASQTTLVDSGESAPDLDPLIDTQETRAAASEAEARPSARALYVPSPLPMVELKQQLAREAAEELESRSPTQRPPPPNAAPVEAKPPAGFEKAIDQRFASCVDSEELSAKRAVPALANQAPIPAPTPVLMTSWLQPTAPVVVPIEPILPTVQPIAPLQPHSRKLYIALFALAVGVVGTALGIRHGDLTKADAQNAMSVLRSAAQHVVAYVRRT